MLKLKEMTMSKFQAFNKYILTRKVKIMLASFVILTAVFYLFTSVNLAVSMFFAFMVMGVVGIIIRGIDVETYEALRDAAWMRTRNFTNPFSEKE
jgi:hypothetical protein